MRKLDNVDLLLTCLNHPRISSKFSDNLLQYFELFSFEKGDILIKQGICSDYLYFIIKGKARIYTYTSSGDITLLSFAETYEPLGDSASLWGEEAIANVQAITDGICIGIFLHENRKILLEDPIFLRTTCETLAHKLNESNKIVANFFLGSI